MTFDKYEPKSTVRTYTGIHVGFSSVGISIKLSRLMKENGWQQFDIFVDKEIPSVLFKKSDTGKFRFDWSQPLNAKLTKMWGIPEGRYHLVEHTMNDRELYFEYKSVV